MEVRAADLRDPDDLAAVRGLWSAYLDWALAEISARYPVELDAGAALDLLSPDGPFAPPGGTVLLAQDGGRPVATAAAKTLRPGVTEIKRMYVTPDHRGRGLGRTLLETLIEHARSTGAREVVLDSNRFMVEAHALYRSAGFTDCAPHEGTEIPYAYHPYWRFMRRPLDAADG